MMSGTVVWFPDGVTKIITGSNLVCKLGRMPLL